MRIPQYMQVSADRFELPMASSDTVWDLAHLLGVTTNYVEKQMRRFECGKKTRFRKVWVELDEDETQEWREEVVQARLRAGMIRG